MIKRYDWLLQNRDAFWSKLVDKNSAKQRKCGKGWQRFLTRQPLNLMWRAFYLCQMCYFLTHDFLKSFFFSFYSMLFGNLYIYFDWNGRTEIPGWGEKKKSNDFYNGLVCNWWWLIEKKKSSCFISGEAFYFIFLAPSLCLSDSSRKNIFLCLLVASGVGTLSFLVLKTSSHDEEMLSEEEGESLLPARVM